MAHYRAGNDKYRGWILGDDDLSYLADRTHVSGDYRFGTTPGKHGRGHAASTPVRAHGEALCES
jgi:hypothetical protein